MLELFSLAQIDQMSWANHRVNLFYRPNNLGNPWRNRRGWRVFINLSLGAGDWRKTDSPRGQRGVVNQPFHAGFVK